MIEINLVPLEQRPSERTPPLRLLTYLVGVMIVSSMSFVIVYLHSELTSDRARRDEASKATAQKKRKAAEVDAIKKDIDALGARHGDVQRLYLYRREWAPILNGFAQNDVLPSNVWLASMEYKKSASAKAGPSSLSLSGFVRITSGVAAFPIISEFMKHIQEGHPIYKDVFDGEVKLDGDTSAQAIQSGDGIPQDAPKEALTFTLKIDMKPDAKPESKKKKK